MDYECINPECGVVFSLPNTEGECLNCHKPLHWRGGDVREHTYPISYESHLRRRVKELQGEIERLEEDWEADRAIWREKVEELQEDIRKRDELLDRMGT